MRKIRKVAILGSGIMGSRIACHFANIGCEVVMLDIPPKELNDKEKAKGLSLDHKLVRNRIVNDSLQTALKSNPSPIYKKSFASRITTGNFEDNMDWISSCDWIMEVVVERLDIKKIIFDQVEKYRTKGTLISSNTSGIPIHMMLEGRSEDFQDHFCGTHFFNPPRYLQLMEVIPTDKTKPEIVDFFMDYGYRFLGKKTVLCKDTPAFIANRVGVYAIMSLFHAVKEMDMTIEEVDKLTGPVLGRPKSATFRTCDVVGLDTLVHVANGLKENCPDDEEKELFKLPDFVSKMMENNWLGSKTNQGFYKKTKNAEGKREILSLDLNSLEYRAKKKANFPTLAMTKSIDDLEERTKVLLNAGGKEGEFYKKIFGGIFAYVANRLPEISDDLYKIDDALKAGFGWELGPFETWDIIGFDKGLAMIEAEGKSVAPWISKLKGKNIKFYGSEDGRKTYFDVNQEKQVPVPNQEDVLSLKLFKEKGTVWSNSDCHLIDIGDGVLNLEFHSKMNTIGSGILDGINKALDIAEKEYKGLVVSNEGQHFSAGANVGAIFMYAVEQEYDELDFAIRLFQNTMMRLRYSSVPVVVAPHNMALGGGCEINLHADKVVAHSELYMGLVEFGVGLIPGGGGTKEFAKRLSDELNDGDIKINRLRERFLTIGQAKVSTSAYEAFDLGLLIEGRDEVVMNRELLLSRAKEACIELSDAGYTQPVREKNVTVVGQEGLGIVYVGADSMKSGDYISEHDQFISEKLGFVLCGGDLSENTQVSEQYLLDLERKTFLELCTKQKTLERLQSILTKGKILRN